MPGCGHEDHVGRDHQERRAGDHPRPEPAEWRSGRIDRDADQRIEQDVDQSDHGERKSDRGERKADMARVVVRQIDRERNTKRRSRHGRARKTARAGGRAAVCGRDSCRSHSSAHLPECVSGGRPRLKFRRDLSFAQLKFAWRWYGCKSALRPLVERAQLGFRRFARQALQRVARPGDRIGADKAMRTSACRFSSSLYPHIARPPIRTQTTGGTR